MEIKLCEGNVRTKHGIKKDKRLVKTKKSLLEAILRLLGEKSLSEITVTELTEEAGINRKTFYLHYDRTEDIIRDFSDDLLNCTYRELTESAMRDGGKDMAENFRAVNRVLSENLEFFRYFVRSGAYQYFIDKAERRRYVDCIRQLLPSLFGQDSASSYVAEYVLSGVCAVYVRWLEQDTPDMTLDELAAIASKLVSATVSERTMHTEP